MRFGPVTQSSPRSLAFTISVLPSSDMRRPEQLATISPTPVLGPTSDKGSHDMQVHVVSVMPQPWRTVPPVGMSFSTSSQTSRPRGAAPHPMEMTLDRSYFLASG